MSTATIPTSFQREPELLGQTVVVIGGRGGLSVSNRRDESTRGRCEDNSHRPECGAPSMGRERVRSVGYHGLRCHGYCIP